MKLILFCNYSANFNYQYFQIRSLSKKVTISPSHPQLNQNLKKVSEMKKMKT